MQVVVNAATSVDGKLSTRRREQVRISGPEDFARVDRLRADSDAVLVGIGTVLADDPHLTLDDEDLRTERTARNEAPSPARIVVDSSGRTPLDARILDDTARTHLLVSAAATRERRAALADAGAEIIVAGDEQVSLPAALEELAEQGIERLLVEGGGEIIFSLFSAGLVDELSLYVGSMVIGGRDSPTLADGPGFVGTFPDLSLRDVTRIDDGVLLQYDVDGRGTA